MKFIWKALLVVALFAGSAQAQSLVTIQSSQVAGITNGTTTRNTLTLGAPYVSADILLNITAGGTATGTLQLFLQDSVDNGTTYSDLCASNTFAFGAAPTTQRFRVYASSEGPGFLRSIAGTTPGAGANLTETVPAGARWELLAFKYRLTTSSAVATRVASLLLDDGANVYFSISPQTTQAASLVIDYTAAPGLTGIFSASDNKFAIELPNNNRLGSGHRIRSAVVNIDAADQITAVQYLVREWRSLGFGEAQVTETLPAGECRSGPSGNRLRVREVVSGASGSPVGPTYAISAVFGS